MTGCYNTINIGAEGKGGIVESFAQCKTLDIPLYSENWVCRIINTRVG
jgi:hypothetical protein